MRRKPWQEFAWLSDLGPDQSQVCVIFGGAFGPRTVPESRGEDGHKVIRIVAAFLAEFAMPVCEVVVKKDLIGQTIAFEKPLRCGPFASLTRKTTLFSRFGLSPRIAELMDRVPGTYA